MTAMRHAMNFVLQTVATFDFTILFNSKSSEAAPQCSHDEYMHLPTSSDKVIITNLHIHANVYVYT